LEISERLDLIIIARRAPDTEYNPDKFPGLIMRLENPKVSFLIFSTGSMVITGLKNVYVIEKAVKNVIRRLKKFGFKQPKPETKIQNLVVGGDLRTPIDLNKAVIFMEYTMYEPEVFLGLIYHMQDPKAVFLIFSTGKIVCTRGKNEERVKEAIIKLNKVIREHKLTFELSMEEEYEEIYFL
jgi:transcription initiation factor TFIID TATA-box-binding protein